MTVPEMENIKKRSILLGNKQNQSTEVLIVMIIGLKYIINRTKYFIKTSGSEKVLIIALKY